MQNKKFYSKKNLFRKGEKMNLLKNEIENNLTKENEILAVENNVINKQEQRDFLETTLGKTINFGLDLGLRALLPDFIEQQIIDIKDIFMEEGFSNGVKKLLSSAIDFGKSAAGIVTGNFENISQVQTAIERLRNFRSKNRPAPVPAVLSAGSDFGREYPETEARLRGSGLPA